MAQDILYLLAPQWQGSAHENARQLYKGAWQLQAILSKLAFESVAINPDEKSDRQSGIEAYADVLRHMQDVRTLLQKHRPETIVTIGGDCSVDLGPVSYLNAQYGDKLAVIWLDAHSDLNTPQSSPGGGFHGMVLRSLLGEGEKELLEHSFSTLSPDQIFLAGVRAFDKPELAYHEEHRIKLFRVHDLEKHPEMLIEGIQARGFNKVHIHLDLDVLEPSKFSSINYPTLDGLSPEGLMIVLQALSAAFDVVGLSLTEYAPKSPDDEMILERILSVAPLIK